MSAEVRIPDGIDADPPPLQQGLIFWAKPQIDTWEDARAELTAAFEKSRAAAHSEESFVYIVSNDALLGRTGPTDAMVAAGLLSAARTAALEGWKKGWTANVVAYDKDHSPEEVLERALILVEDGMITGELLHIGQGHIGKALA
ncbi:MAG: hypothetical protein WDZ96_04490 [Acidimicrobiia bacterium]